MNTTAKQLISLGESEKVEFKLSFGKDVVETLCAFANHKGGKVIIGFDNTSKIDGVLDSHKVRGSIEG